MVLHKVNGYAAASGVSRSFWISQYTQWYQCRVALTPTMQMEADCQIRIHCQPGLGRMWELAGALISRALSPGLKRLLAGMFAAGIPRTTTGLSQADAAGITGAQCIQYSDRIIF